MDKTSAAQFVLDLNALAEVLNRCEEVRRYDAEGEKQAWTLAHSLLDLEQSFRTFLNEQLPRLRDGRLTAEETREALFEIGEELRHVLYHIRDPQFFAYLYEDTRKVRTDNEPS